MASYEVTSAAASSQNDTRAPLIRVFLIGPKACGKSSIIHAVCGKKPEDVYQEISEDESGFILIEAPDLELSDNMEAVKRMRE
ncbi:unnamed protein product, partial [Rotaria sp. Silwood1]